MSINSSNSASCFFEQDDEETWNLLVSASPSDDDIMGSRLGSLTTRFQGDSDSSYQDYWKNLLNSVQRQGFNMTIGDSSSSPSTPSVGGDEFPAAFQSEAGKKHIEATSSLLRISKQRSVQVTLSALRSVTSDVPTSDEKTPRLQSLLGTRALLKTVMRYHFKQRLARLQVVAECLRMEQDDQGTSDAAAIVNAMNSLDDTATVGGRNRGLFRRLLTVACKPESLPTRDELVPSLQLHDKPSSHLVAASQPRHVNNDSADFSYNSFVAECREAFRRQIHLERVQAMEALLVLLYDRIQNGVHRIDYAILLNAFECFQTFFTGCKDHERLCELAGLICSECMGLWRVFALDEDSSAWVTSHPLLLGVVEAPSEMEREAEKELETLRLMLQKFSSQVLSRRKQQLALARVNRGKMQPNDADDCVVEAPEALALLSFGLLLSLAYMAILPSQAGSDSGAYWRDFNQFGMECTAEANDQGGAFAYLHAVMESLVSAPHAPESKLELVEEENYDWLLSNPLSSVAALETAVSRDDSSAATVAYASIGREILVSTISAFRETILSIHHEAACENIGMLCGLAGVIYQNQPILCEQFWIDYDAFTVKATSDAIRTTQDDPLCYLLDSTYNLAVSALNAATRLEQQPGLEEALLPALEPLLRLLSSLCSDCNRVQSILGLLPDGMIRTALLCCSPTSTLSNDAVFFKHALSALNSVATFDRFGNSKECRLLMQKALEAPGNAVQCDGPRVLFRIVSNSNNRTDLATVALEIMGDMFESSSTDPLWALSAAKFFEAPTGFVPFLTWDKKELTLSALHVLKGFVTHLTTIVFNQACKESDMTKYMETVVQGALVACTFLSSMLASSGNQLSTSASPVSYPVAHQILEVIALLFKATRPIASLNGKQNIRSAALDLRNTMVNTLATSTPLGDSISYFATAPVSLSLAASLSKHLEEAQVWSLASNKNDVDEGENKYGAWQSVISNQADSSKSPNDLLGKYVEGLVSDIQKLDLDMDTLRSLGWIGADQLVCLQTARAAVDVLLAWAMHAEDIVAEQVACSSTLTAGIDEDLGALSPYRLLLSLAVVPPPVRENQMLSSLWPTEKTSTLQLLLRFLPGDKGDSTEVSDNLLPTCSTIELFTMCFRHAKNGQGIGNPSMSLALGRNEHIQATSLESLKQALQLTSTNSKTRFTSDENLELKEVLLLLRMLCTCVDTQPHLAAAIFVNSEGKPSTLTDLLIETSSKFVAILRQSGNDYAAQLSTDFRLLCNVRIASGCLDVLLALWRTTGDDGRDVATKKLALAVKCLSKEGTFLGDLVSFVTTHSSIVQALQCKDSEGQIALDLHIRAVLMNCISCSLDILSIEMVGAMKDSRISDSDSIWGLVRRGTDDGSAMLSMSENYTTFDGATLIAAFWRSITKSFRNGFASNAHIGGARPKDLLFSFPASSFDRFEELHFTGNICNVFIAANFLSRHSAVNDADSVDGLSSQTWTESTGNVNASFVLLSRQLKLTSAWTRFAQVLLMKETQATNDGNQEETAANCRSLAIVTLDYIHRTVKTAELSQLDMPADFVSAESGSMMCALADLLLQALTALIENPSAVTQSSAETELTKMLGQLYDSSNKIFSIMCLPVSSAVGTLSLPSPNSPEGQGEIFKHFYIVQQRLMASAIILVTASESFLMSSNPLYGNQELRNEYCVGLVDMSCRTVTLIWHQSNGKEEGSANEELSQQLLRTCVALLTLLVSRGTDEKAGVETSTYLEYTAKSIRKHEAVRSLVQVATTASTRAASSQSSSLLQPPGVSLSNDRQRENDVEIVRGIFMFMSAVADAGEASLDMLSLLTDSGVSRIILNNPLFQIASEQWSLTGQTNGSVMNGKAPPVGIHHYRLLRGYVPSESKSSFEKRQGGMTAVSGGRFFAGRDDPVHDIWRTAIRTLVAVVRSSRHLSHASASENMNFHFVNIALDFVRTNEATLLHCLRECSSVPFGDKQEVSASSSTIATTINYQPAVYTFNGLREAGDILSLISELCTGMNRNQFEMASPNLHKLFVRSSLDMTRSLGQFLGAAGAARELFNALDKAESNELIPPEDALLDSSSDIEQLLEGGIPNARHEAIRNAHYAIRCCAFVTAEDYDAFDKSALSPSNDRAESSAESLEMTCQVAINSAFTKKMELAAAAAYYHAVSVLWETHPASTAFVVFTPEEASRLDSMSLVKTGMIIALREPDKRRSREILLEKSTVKPDPNFCFAQVLGTDTIRRVWHVKYLKSFGSDRDSEDVVSADLLAGVEDLMKRKCFFEYHFAESASAVESAGGGERNATLGHLILSLRWCYQYYVNSKNSSGNFGHYELIKCLTERTSVLLGTEVSLHNIIGTTRMTSADVTKRVNSQLLDLFGGVSFAGGQGPREGRLKKILDESTWATLQQQLEPELEAAKTNREEIRKKSEQSTFGSTSPYRRNTFFRGVSF